MNKLRYQECKTRKKLGMLLHLHFALNVERNMLCMDVHLITLKFVKYVQRSHTTKDLPSLAGLKVVY